LFLLLLVLIVTGLTVAWLARWSKKKPQPGPMPEEAFTNKNRLPSSFPYMPVHARAGIST